MIRAPRLARGDTMGIVSPSWGGEGRFPHRLDWLRGGMATGVLIGGSLGSLEHLRGTGFWPTWRDAVTFFETSEEAPPPERVDSLVT